MILKKTLKSPLDCKEIQPVHPKGDQSWVFIGRTVVDAETLIIWPPDAKSWLIGKDPDAGKDWGQEETGTTEDEMTGWHHRLDGHGFGWTPGVGDGQGGLVCCDSWGCKESDTELFSQVTELNWYVINKLKQLYFLSIWLLQRLETLRFPVTFIRWVRKVISLTGIENSRNFWNFEKGRIHLDLLGEICDKRVVWLSQLCFILKVQSESL